MKKRKVDKKDDLEKSKQKEISYSFNIITSPNTLNTYLNNPLPIKKFSFMLSKKQPLHLSKIQFLEVYLNMQKTFINSANDNISIYIHFPNEEIYCLETDRKKIVTNSFLELLYESMMLEDDLLRATNLFEYVQKDLVVQPSNSIEKNEKELSNIESDDNPMKESKKTAQGNELSKKDEIPPEKENIINNQQGVPQTQTKQDFENNKYINFNPNLFEVVDLQKQTINLQDPEYEEDLINKKKIKINQLVHKESKELENSVNQRINDLKNELNKNISIIKTEKLNKALENDNLEELISVYKEKEKELDNEKRTRMLELNEFEQQEINLLKKKFEQEEQELKNGIRDKKEKFINQLDNQFTSWEQKDYSSQFEQHYANLLAEVNQEIEELQRQNIQDIDHLVKEISLYLEKPLKEYETVSKEYLQNEIPKIKDKILKDLQIYRERLKNEKLKNNVTKAELEHLLKQQEIRFQEAIESQKEIVSSEKLEMSSPAESEKEKQPNKYLYWLKKNSKIIFALSISIFFIVGLGLSVYKKVTYVPPFDTMIKKENYVEAISKYPEKKYDVVETLYNEILEGDSSKVSVLEKVSEEENNILADFFLSILNTDFKKGLAVYEKGKNKVPQKYWDKQSAILGYSYLKEGNLSKAEEFQEKAQDTVLSERIDNFKTIKASIEELEQSIKSSEKELEKIKDKNKKEELQKQIHKLKDETEKLKSRLANI